MARVLVVEPVQETRELIERLVVRMGHQVVGGDSLRDIDVVFYEPASRAGLALAKRVQAERPQVGLVAISASPPRAVSRDLRPVASLLQPFSPGDLRKVLERVIAAAPSAQPA